MDIKRFKRVIFKKVLSPFLALATAATLMPLPQITASAADSITVSQDTESTYTPTQIVNGGFESSMGATTKGTDQGWCTTDTKFETSNRISTYKISSSNGIFAEMNADHTGTLYQNLTTHGGDIIKWSLKHGYRPGAELQYMSVYIGAPASSGSVTATNPNITSASLGSYKYDSTNNVAVVTGSYAYYKSDSDLAGLNLSSARTSDWNYCSAIYVVPDGQTVTRFAFESDQPANSSYGNLLDDVTFSTLLGNLSATADNDRNITIKGYWGDSDSTKKLVIQIGSTTHEIDMSNVLNKNFSISIPASMVDATASSVVVYHQDYQAASRTVTIKKVPTINNVYFDDATGKYTSNTGDMGIVTTYYDENNNWTTTIPASGANYLVGFSVAESDTYAGYGSASSPATDSTPRYYTTALLYVKADGNDSTGNGTVSNPYKTIKKAYEVLNASGHDSVTIALLSDITMDDGDQVWIETTKSVTITSASSNGTLLTNAADSYTGVYTIYRGDITNSLFVLNSGNLTLTQVILDGGSKNFDYTADSGNKNSGGFLINVLSSAGSPTLTLTTNSKLQNNWNLGNNGASWGGALVIGYDRQTSYYPVVYMKSNAEISGNKAPRHGGAITCYTGSKVYLSDDSRIKDNCILYSSSYTADYYGGGAILVHNNSELHMSGNAAIYNNYVDLSGQSSSKAAAVQVEDTGKIYLSGNAKIFDNFSKNVVGLADNSQSNIYDKITGGNSIIIEGPLGDSAKIGITASSLTAGTKIATGTSAYTLQASDAEHVYDDSMTSTVIASGNYFVLKSSFTAVSVVSKNISADKFVITTDIGIDLTSCDDSVFINDVQLDKSQYTITADSDAKTITVTFAEPLSANDSVGVQINKNGYKFNDGKIAEAMLKSMTVSVTNGTAVYSGTATNGGASLSFTDPASGYTVKYGTVSGTYTLDQIPTYTNAGTYTVYYKITADNYADETGSLTITVSKKDQTAPSLTVTAETVSKKEDGTIGGLSTDMEYKLSTGTSYTDVTNTGMELAAGTYYVRYKEDSNHNASPVTSVTVNSGRKLSVTLPSSQTGYSLTVDSASNDWHATPVITFTIKDGYSRTDSFAVKVNGTVITMTATSSGETYTIPAMEENVTVTVEGVADITAPSGYVKLTTNTWNSILNTVTFDLFFKDTQTVTATASDAGSGIASSHGVQYYIAHQKMTDSLLDSLSSDAWTDYTAQGVKLDPNDKYVVYFKLTDNDGNKAYLSTDGIVEDNKAPAVSGIESNKTYSGATEFTVSDANLDSVKLDGTEMTASDGKYTLPADDTAHTVTLTDKAGNVTEVTNVRGNILAATPVIGTQPSSISVYAGEDAEFSIAATSSDGGTLTYKWQKQAGGTGAWSDIAGAAAANYKVTAAAYAENGDKYRCIVTNTLGNGESTDTVSDEVTLSVSLKNPTASDYTFTAPENLVYDGSARNASVTSAKDGMGTITVKYYSDSACTTEVAAKDLKNAGTYYVAIDMTEGLKYAAVTKLTDASWAFTIAKADQSIKFTFVNVTKMAIKNPDYTQTVIGANTAVTYSGNNDEVATVNASTGEVTILKDGTVTITATAVEGSNYKEASATYTLTVEKDTTAPTVDIKNGTSSIKKVLNVITFGLFFKNTQKISVIAEDTDTGVDKVYYYVSDEILTEAQIQAVTGWTEGKSVSLNPNDKYVVYVKVTDKAGNVTYAASEGMVLDDVAPVIAGVESNTIYSGNTEFTVTDDWLDTVKIDDTVVTAVNGKYIITADDAVHTVIATDKAGNTTTLSNITVYILNNAKASDFTFTAPADLVYDGNAKKVSVTSSKDGMGTITVKYYTDSALSNEVNAANVTEGGTYYVGINLEQGVRYLAATKLTDASWKFTIERADQTLTFDETSVSKMAIKEPEYTQTVNGAKTTVTYSGNDDNVAQVDASTGKVDIYGAGVVTITATAAQSDNYNEASVSYTLTVVNDETAPTVDITIDDESIKKDLDSITFEKYFRYGQTISIIYDDADTGVDKVYYFVSNVILKSDQVENIAGWIEGTSVTVKPSNRYVIYAKVVDKAGNISYAGTDGIVLDNIAPVISGIQSDCVYEGETGFTVADFCLGSVKIDNKEVFLTDGKYILPADNVSHTVTAGDKSGNITEIKNVTAYASYTEDVTGDNGAETDSDAVSGDNTDTFSGESETVYDDNIKVSAEKQLNNFAEGGIRNTAEELNFIVFTEEELSSIEAGEKAEVWVVTEDKTSEITDTEMTAVDEVLPENYTVGSYIDLTLWKQVGENEASSVSETPNGQLTIGFTVPEELQQEGRTYKIVSIVDGVATVIDAEVDEDYNLTFETSEYGTVAIIYEDDVALSSGSLVNSSDITADSASQTSGISDGEQDENEKSGHVFPWWIILIVIALCAGGYVIYRKRKS